ncbi:MAG: hypothetical protein JSS82_13250 [Bacteroidetes bacterium]|nr:hypothetical protein [Bacteroidota bacterium]
MKIVSFNREVHNALISKGYTHLEIRERINDEFVGDPGHKQVQIFKALDRIDTMPAKSHIELISSTVINNLLSDEELNCYVVIQESDNL